MDEHKVNANGLKWTKVVKMDTSLWKCVKVNCLNWITDGLKYQSDRSRCFACIDLFQLCLFLCFVYLLCFCFIVCCDFCLLMVQNINPYRAKNKDNWEPSHQGAIPGRKIVNQIWSRSQFANNFDQIWSRSQFAYLSKPFSREPRRRAWNLWQEQFNIAARLSNSNCTSHRPVCFW